MMKRSPDDLPRGRVAIYTNGFPCQPFSLLHNNSALMDEPKAKVFMETVKTIYLVKPLLAILENVVGLSRVWHIVEEKLSRLTDYIFCRVIIDPFELGDGVRRRRYYIILVKKFSVCF